jgi:WD40 repeat protein
MGGRRGVTSDGQHAVSGAWDHTLKVWNLETGDELRTLVGHKREIQAMAVTPDGGRVVSASADHTLKVWDLETREELASVALDGALACLALDSHGVPWCVTGDSARNVHCLRYVKGDGQR